MSIFFGCKLRFEFITDLGTSTIYFVIDTQTCHVLIRHSLTTNRLILLKNMNNKNSYKNE